MIMNHHQSPPRRPVPCAPTRARAEVEYANVVRVLVGHDEPLAGRAELEVARSGPAGVLVRRILQIKSHIHGVFEPRIL